MQYVNRARVPPPEGIQNFNLQENSEKMLNFLQISPERRAQTRVPESFSSGQSSGALSALHELFHGRCAFCESESDDVGLHFFRPISGAEPQQRSMDAHIYYAWLAYAWQNLYLACPRCNRHANNYFPVRGKRAPIPSADQFMSYLQSGSGLWPDWPPKENPLLLDPCKAQSFFTHFTVQNDGVIVAVSESGRETISTYDLNRESLVRQRAKRFGEYLGGIVEAINTRSLIQLKRYFRFVDLEYGGGWYLLLRRIAERLGTRKGPKPVLSPTRIVRVFLPLLKEPQGFDWLLDAIGESRREEPLSDDAYSYAKSSVEPLSSLHSARFHHFKSLEEITLTVPPAPYKTGETPIAPAVLILGENATGKSSLLEGIALALTTEAARKRLSLKWRSYVLDPKYMGGSTGRESRVGRVDIVSSGQATLSLTLQNGGYQIHRENGFNLGPVFAYGAFRHYQHKKRLFVPDHPVRNLFDGNLLGNPQAWLLTLEDDHFNMVIRALREVLAIEGEFDVVERDKKAQECLIVTSMTKQTGDIITIRTPLSIVSSGFRSVLGMVCDIMAGLMNPDVNPGFTTLETARGVVLIDEIEAHLHPRWKMQIMNGLRKALPGLTFIVTTHDPLCLRGMRDGEVVVLQRVINDDISIESEFPTVVQTLTALPHLSTMRVDQLLTSDFFQLYSTVEPKVNQQMAHVADLIAKMQQAIPLNDEEKRVMSAFEEDIAAAMPVGTSEAHRLVQEAVADYLKQRHAKSAPEMGELRISTREKIVDILRRVLQ